MRVEAAEETAGFSGIFSKRAHSSLRTYIESFPLDNSTRAAAERAPAAYGEKLKCLLSEQVLGDSFPSDKTPEASQQPLSLF